MTIKSFAELTKQVHLLNDMILSDTICDTVFAGKSGYAEEVVTFTGRLFTTKYWFVRTSWPNKRRYILALMEDLRSAWALSLLLKSLWNCRPKDAVLSISDRKVWSSYDQIPMDHNRTAQPVKTLGQVMTNDRKWFHSLEPESQAMVLTELVTMSGGRVMWEVLHRGQRIYERHREHQLRNLLECIVVEQGKPEAEATKEVRDAPLNTERISGKAQKELDACLAVWNSMIKTLRESQKLEELEMTFKDGSKRTIWKVNRVKPEAIETVDFIQLLPSAIGKRILSYLPHATLGDYAKVNRYWAYLVDELRIEWATRTVLDSNLQKLQELMIEHDTSLEVLATSGVALTAGSVNGNSISPSTWGPQAPSMRPSERSAGAISFRFMVMDKLKPTHRIKQKPIQKLSDLDERLERRGAADENIWQWCENVLKCTNSHGSKPLKDQEGVMRFTDLHFPCPLMKHSITLPLDTPLTRDPAQSTYGIPMLRRNTFNASLINIFKTEPRQKRFSLWSRNVSSLYKVLKLASYESPV